jgi:hypothetical protein
VLISVLVLCHCDQRPDVNDLREEEFIVTHGFREFSPWPFGSMFLDLWEDRTITVEGSVWRGGCSLLGRQEAESKTGTGGQVSPSKTNPQ